MCEQLHRVHYHGVWIPCLVEVTTATRDHVVLVDDGGRVRCSEHAACKDLFPIMDMVRELAGSVGIAVCSPGRSQNAYSNPRG